MSETPKTPIDEPVRRRIVSDLDTNMLVEAAAGTGKTTMLVARMVALVREGRCGIGNIAAVTFTVKAAAQLRERFQEKLEEELLRLEPGEERVRIGHALEHLSTSFVGTIHAFCSRLLRERPVESGLDPGFTEVAGDEAEGLPLEFWDRYIQQLFIANDPRLTALDATGIPPGKLHDFFGRICEYPDVEAVRGDALLPDVSDAYAQVLEFLDEIESELPAKSVASKDAFNDHIRSLLRRRKGVRPHIPSSLIDFLEATKKNRKPVQKNWPDKVRPKYFEGRYNDLLASTVEPALRRWREHAHAVVMELVKSGMEDFADERKRQGKLTFQDLLMASCDLLRDHPNVRRYFQGRFTHLLVDEFQDTDPIQAEIVFYLTGEQLEERDWRKLGPRPGSLFIVGDPKQSIYRFRRADIATYLQVQELIEKSGGVVLKLITNFRSVPEACTFVNDFFRQVFTGRAVIEKRQAAHVDVVASREARPAGGVYLLETQVEGNRGDLVAAEEARCIAQWIRNAYRMGVADDSGQKEPRWSDFMLLSWTRIRLQIYAEALHEAGVPFEVTGARAFSESEELALLIPFLRAVIEIDDAVSVVSFLRGPLCGVDDQALFDYRQLGGRFRYVGPPPAGTDLRIVDGFELLRWARQLSGGIPPAALIAQVIERLGLAALAASRVRGEVRSGNLQKALTMARRSSAAGMSLAGIVASLEFILQSPRCEIEEMSIDPVRDDVVRLMNVHQAKGLEAAVVFLIDPSEQKEFPIQSHIDRDGGTARGFFAINRPKKPNSWADSPPWGIPPGWEEMEKIERDSEQREHERLMYVAATRARNLLVVGFQRASSGEPQGPWKRFVTQQARPLFGFPPGEPAVQKRVPSIPIEFEAARLAIASRRRRSHGASYAVTPVTKVVHPDGSKLVKIEEGYGRGTSWGRVLHRLFEAMLREEGLDLELFATNLLKDEEREVAEIGDVLRLVDAVERSAIWKRVLGAEERYVEVPFAIEVSSRELGLTGPATTLLHGAIDLVFREGNEWFLLDYKSDQTAGRLEALVAYYRPQVDQYAKWWRKMTGTATRAGLYFVDSGEVVWMSGEGKR